MTKQQVLVPSLNAYREYAETRVKLRFAEDRRDIAFRGAFPVGASICWMHGEYTQTGEVVRHLSGDSLIARNHKTGRQVPVSGFWIMQAVDLSIGAST